MAEQNLAEEAWLTLNDTTDIPNIAKMLPVADEVHTQKLSVERDTLQAASVRPLLNYYTARRRTIPRNTVHDTWRWLWKDTLGRIVPFIAASAIYARASGRGARGVGFTRDGWVRDLAIGTAAGIPLAGIAAAYRGFISPNYRLPTPADQTLQTTFYLGVNAPAEELFWRGMVQTLTIAGLQRLSLRERKATLLGWALTTATFGAYHRLGNWSWRAIAGVTVAGGLFGAAYLATGKRRSLLAPTIMHGFMTAGFLSWGDALLYWRGQQSTRRQSR